MLIGGGWRGGCPRIREILSEVYYGQETVLQIRIPDGEVCKRRNPNGCFGRREPRVREKKLGEQLSCVPGREVAC